MKPSAETTEGILRVINDTPPPKPIIEHPFWDVSAKGRITIDRDRLMDFLHVHGGFAIYYFDASINSYRIVQLQDHFLREVTSEHIKKYILNYLKKDHPKVLALFMEKADVLIGRSAIEFLPRGEYNFLRDSKNEAFFTFKNGIVSIKAGKFTLQSYYEIGRVIWRTQVIDFDIQINDTKPFEVEYFMFLFNMCKEDMDKVDYAITLIGYLLHKYKDPTRAWAVILAEETENEKEGGGTGKGIFFKAISKLINTVTIDGKSFKQDKSFAFQRVDLDTHLIILQDVKKDVNFELFYPMITEGMTVEKKNQHELFIHYQDSPKIGFTTNYAVKSTGVHGKRRQKVFEFGSYYSDKFTPEDDFKHKLFDDWTHEEWNRFYNFMFLSVQAYLEDGVKEIGSSDTMKRKQLRLSYGEEFSDWWYDFIKIPQNFNTPVMQKFLYDSFLKEASFSDKDYSYKRFKSGCISGCDLVGITISFKKNYQAGGAKEVTFTR